MSYTTFGAEHIASMLIILAVWVIILFWGSKLNQWQIQFVATLLAVLTITVEFFDDVYRFQDGHWLLIRDLPLHMCGFSTFLSAYALYTRSQMSFEFAFFWGIGGALQAMITVDLTGINNMIGSFALNWQHSIIILNVLWLIFAYNKRFNLRGVFNAFIFINLAIIPVGIINYLLSANYMFICFPPNVNNPLLIGQWPTYLIVLEFIYFIYILILYIPFKLLNKK